MKTNYLFPHKLKWISGVLFIISFLLLVALIAFDKFGEFEYKVKVFAIADGFITDNSFFSWVENSILDEVLMIIIIPSGLIFAFSKEKHEDEMVASIRLQSLAIATIANYLILLFCYMFIFGLPFLNVMMAAMFSQLVIFIMLFRFKIYQLYNSKIDEE